MALEEFENEQDGKDKRYLRMRSIRDYSMGIIWLAMGFFLAFPTKFSDKFEQYNDPLIKIFAGICIVYGLFRMYRGYKKNYYNER
jgi:hypothetical protein